MYFTGVGVAVQGIYSGTSAADLQRVVDSSQLIPGDNDEFTGFGDSFSVFGGKIAFVGFGGDGQQGLYTNLTGTLAKVFDLEDRLPGDNRVPGSISLHPQSLSAGRLAFQVHFTDNSAAIVEARYTQTNVYDFSIVSGQQITGQDFGTRPDNGALKGEVFVDSDGDGIHDSSESAYPNLTVYLDQNNNRTRDTNEALTTSDSLGRFAFTNLPTLTSYTVAVELPSGLIFTTPGASNFNRYTLTLGAGETRESLNFGLAPAGGGGGVASDSIVQGRLYIDANSNGRYDSEESLLINRPVYLDFDNDNMLDPEDRQTITDANGLYSFGNLPAGAYSVRVVSQSDLVQTSPLGNNLTPTTAPTGDGPETIAAGDFNRDGFPDLIVANTQTNNVSLLINNGNNGFTASLPLAVGNLPSGVVVADFNQDGWDDFAAIGYSSQFVTLYLNTRNITTPFSGSQGASLLGTANFGGPDGITVADFNQDGWPDLAVADALSKKVELLLNTGTSGGLQLSYSGAIMLAEASDVVAGQFTDDNGDTLYNSADRADLAVLNNTSGAVLILRNDGNGVFNTLGNFAVGNGANRATAADVNGDGKVDLITANFDSGTVSVLMNIGGSFSSAHYSAGGGPTAVVAVDLDNDGDRDLAVANKSTRQFSILRNNGRGVRHPGQFRRRQHRSRNCSLRRGSRFQPRSGGRPDRGQQPVEHRLGVPQHAGHRFASRPGLGRQHSRQHGLWFAASVERAER